MLFNHIFLSVLDIQTLCRVRHAYTVQVVHSAVLRQVVYLHAFDASGSVECLLSSLQSLCGSVQVICGSVSLGSDSLSGIDGFLQSLARISVGSRLTQQVVSGSNLLVESLLGNSLVVSLLGSLQCLSGSIQLVNGSVGFSRYSLGSRDSVVQGLAGISVGSRLTQQVSGSGNLFG